MVCHEPSHKYSELQRRWSKFHFTRIEAAHKEHFLHERSHAARILADRSQMVLALGRLYLFEVVLQDFRR
jgi:hypothetical protein